MKVEDLDLEHIAKLLHITEKCRLHPNLKPIHDACLNRLHEIATPPPVVEEDRRIPRYEAPSRRFEEPEPEEYRNLPRPHAEVPREQVDEALRREPPREPQQFGSRPEQPSQPVRPPDRRV